MGGDGRREADEVVAGSRRLPGTAQEVIDVDPGRSQAGSTSSPPAVRLVVPEMSRSRQSISVATPPSSPTSTGSLNVIVVYGPDCGCVWVKSYENAE